MMLCRAIWLGDARRNPAVVKSRGPKRSIREPIRGPRREGRASGRKISPAGVKA